MRKNQMLQTKEDRSENGFVCPASEKERLISEHIPLIKFHASRLATQLFSPKGADQLIDAGVMGLIEAATSYEQGGELEFKAYADQCIRAAMIERLRALNGTGWPISPKAGQSKKPSQKLRPKLQYEASDLELSMALGIDVEQLASFELNAQLSGLSVGGFSAVPREGDQVETEEKLVGYYPENHSDRPSRVVEKGRLLQILTQAVNELPPSERLVISLHYLEELTMKEVAMILRMGEWRVLQLHTKAVLRLRTKLRLHLGPHE
jgi:RNA polymerase sigma factor for flagellar operon FliA